MGEVARQYGRDDVDYATFYTSWMKQLALNKTREELESLLGIKHGEAAKAARQHLRAIERTGGMQSNSQARAQSGNATRAAGDFKIAIEGALEIYDLFPEHTKGRQ